MESVLSTIGSGNQTPGLRGKLPAEASCWPLVFIVVKGFSCISRAKFSVR